MRDFVRISLTRLFVGVVVAIVLGAFGEWFIEVAKDKGLYKNAGQTWDSIMSIVVPFIFSKGFIAAFFGLTGIVTGFWLDKLLRKIDQHRATNFEEIDWYFLDSEVSRVLKQVQEDGDSLSSEHHERTIGRGSATGFIGIIFYLAKRKMFPEGNLPSLETVSDIELFLTLSNNHLTAISPFVRARDRESVIEFGKVGLEMANKAIDRILADREVTAGSPAPQSPQDTETEMPH